ncbi:linker for activation of T-cells family member 2 [Myotis lucifugus]|uniref:linker for activation of T-cells family member 2 n=1 Tax=Myotis lucifugus TaxID=59463 RepID=UPI000CCBF409|nr:linker for activation of T-cells family member 2 [Myotis lucifugus]
MSAEAELLWPGVAFLLLLGAVASLCVRCSRSGSGAKRPEKIYEQRNLQENQQNFAVTGTYSLARPLMDTASDLAPTRKDKLLQFSPSLEDSASPRYLNFSKGSRHGSDASYMWLVADDEDANSYENVLICKQKEPDSGDEDYQNSASIQKWRESRKVVGQVPREAPLSPAGIPDEDEDGEPDYVNEDVAATEA